MASNESSLSQDNVDLGIDALRAPGVFPHPVQAIELRETPISLVVLTGLFAYKVKKAVRLDFIDSSTLSRRRELCEEELRLNRRFAPDLYCDVIAVVRDVEGRLRFGGDGVAVEYAVRMRQFEPAQELHALLERDEVGVAELHALATRLAEFHDNAAAASDERAYGGYEQVRTVILDNLRTLRRHMPGEVVPEVDRLEDWTRRQLLDLKSVLEMRKTGGSVRECHGDLHARNIVRWRGELTPFDCLEFDPQLRWIDVMNDTAFLVMDLAARQRSDLAFAFYSRYLESSGDYGGVRLLALFVVYRALVRAKVDALAAESALEQHEFRQRLCRRVHAAGAWIDRPGPILVIMHGVSGSGKSWLSERLAPSLPAVRVRSDVERKRLADAGHDTSLGYCQGIYATSFTNKTYARLLDCAASCLQGGVSVVVDAAFLEENQRRLFQELARHMAAPYIVLSCVADERLLEQRLTARWQAGADVSDAGVAIMRRQLETVCPLAPYERKHQVLVNTAARDVLDTALAAVEYRMANRDRELHEP